MGCQIYFHTFLYFNILGLFSFRNLLGPLTLLHLPACLVLFSNRCSFVVIPQKARLGKVAVIS